MRYTYQEPIVTTVEDREISEEEARELLLRLKESGQSIYMEFEDSEHPEFKKYLENVRITAVNEHTIDFSAYFSGASAKYSDVPIFNVRKIRVLANKSLISKKYRVTRWHMMDVAEVEL